ncbi:MAG: SDR family NAD(P)-dependent oxidoreductase [Methylobacteriaceae bacterium]|nr:SDR family NAD(P)-dependent oxidoreductase [Methylobacteriaceae bacterium]
MAKVAVVTGGSSGIGQPLSLMLARDGYDLLLLNRGAARSAPLLKTIRGTRPDIRADVIETDLMDHASIRRAAAAVAERAPAVAVLVNNAGVLTRQQRLSPQGHDSHFQVNTLAPYLLMNLLRPLLAAAGRSRVLNTGSSAMSEPFVGPLKVDELSRPRRMDILGAYAQSKLALAVIGEEVAPDFARDEIIVRTACPGANRTTMTREGDGMPWILQALVPLLFAPPEKGVATLHHALAGADLGERTGIYLEKRKVKALPAKVRDPDLRARLMSLMQAQADA